MTSDAPEPGSARAGLLCLGLTVLGWGLNWPIIKVVLHDWPPLFARGTAGLVGAGAVAAFALAKGERLSAPPGSFPALALAAATNVFAWMGFSTMAMVWLSVGEGALLVYTMPIWATVLAWPILGLRPTGRAGLALALGIAGVVTLLSGSGLRFGDGKGAGTALALAAAALMGWGTVWARRHPLPLPPVAATAWQIGLGCLPMVAIGVLYERPKLGALSPAGWASMLYMALGPMGLCYLTWFAALRRLPPATAAITMLLVPVIGVVSAALMLGETLGPRELAAFGLTLAGVGLAIRSR